MSASATRTVEGVQIDVEQLFAVQVDFSHLRITITAILDALNKSNARTTALEKELGAVSDKADALAETVQTLQGDVQTGAEKQAATEAALREQVAVTRTLQDNERAAADRIAALERDLAALRDQIPPPPQQGPDYSDRIAALEAALARLAALEASDKELRALLASGNALMSDKMSDLQRAAAEADAAARAAQAQAAAADAAARANKGSIAPAAVAAPAVVAAPVTMAAPITVAAPVAVAPPPPQPQQAAPLPSANNDALLLRLKQLAASHDELTGRVSALETQQASLARQQQVLQQSPAATAAAPTVVSAPAPVQRIPSKTKRGSDSASASTNGNSGASDLDRDTLNRLAQSEAHTARQLAASLAEMAQIQAQLGALERALASKASASALDLKADQADLSELASRGGAQAAQLALLERDLDELRSQMANMSAQQAALQGKVAALADAASCGRCNERRPTLRCGKCALSLCEECDEDLHGAEAPQAMQSHLRTPLGPAGPAPVAAVSIAPSPTPSAAPSFRAPVSSVSSDDELRRWAEDQFALLNRKEKASRVDIHELYSKDKELRAKLDALLKASADDKTAYADLVGALKKLEVELRALVANAAAGGRHYTDNRIEELLLKLRELERALEKGMKSELKRFERDVLVFMESAGQAEGHSHGGDAAVGKVHFRCLSCDQTVGNLQGPSSLLYARAVGQAGAAASAQGAVANGATTLSIERGRELYLNGRDGAVYKGRDPSLVTIAPGDPGRPAQFQVNYGNHAMPTTNARGTTIVDQKTVNAPYSTVAPGQPPPSTPQRGGALLRPSSAHEQHQQRTSLPPTRPATRAGLRSRGGERSSPSQQMQQLEEQRTPERQQLPSNSF